MTDEQNILPQKNPFLLGQNEAETLFLHTWKNGTTHHAWIINGIAGIGKATFAYRIARFLLWANATDKETYSSLNVPENSAIFQQVANGSHPDLMVLERDYIETDRKKIISAIKKGEPLDERQVAGLKKSAFIRVDDVRKIGEFLSKTSFNNGWRIVIIDSADDMNKNAANALLKILEEPPNKTILLLVSNNPASLLPTIRSRCAKLPLKLLSETAIASLLRRYRPQLNETMIAKLAEMSSGSIGKALKYADFDAVQTYEDLCALLYSGKKMSVVKLSEFCSQQSADLEHFNLLQDLVMKFLKDSMINCRDAEALYACWNETRKMFNDCLNINMDKRIMLLNLLTQINKAL